MHNRKLVQIGQEPQLPTVAEYFRNLAARQGEDIRLLKERAEARAKVARRKSVREESWRLHPVLPAADTPPAKGRSRSGKNSSTKRAKPKRHSR